MKKIEINEKFKLALDTIENTDKHIFITGKAGTGKSTLLEYFRSKSKKKIVVLAPTGVAALNVKGQTIHSFFRFRVDVTLEKIKKITSKDKNIYSELDAIVIDEISMVRADLMDCIDKFLRINCGSVEPFGGKQMIFIGDLYQLPPVVNYKEREAFKNHYSSPYFFSSRVYNEIKLEMIELDKIYRQTDEKFIDILNAIRNNSITNDMLDELNKRLDIDFEPDIEDFYIWLTTKNDRAKEINEERLAEVDEEEHIFNAEIYGDFNESSFPNDEELVLKVGSQVMFLNNDSEGEWVNGTIGNITYIDEGEGVIYVELMDGDEVEVVPYTWELFNYKFNAEERTIETESVGSFTQYPIKLAWAITIHKSQGKTFEKIILDIGSGTFAPGQMYVGLSRCTSLKGLVLKKEISKKNIFMDWNVVKFMTGFQYDKSEDEMSFENKVKLIEDAIKTKSKLNITYLKPNDIKSLRTIEPYSIGEMNYMGKTFIGIEGYCLERRDVRNFRVDRILEMRVVE